MPKPTDLLQGTLDLLILKTLSREPLHGWAVAKRMLELSDDVLPCSKARSIRPCTGSSSRAGSRRSGRTASTGGKPSSTRSRAKGASSSNASSTSWKRLSSAVGLLLKNA